VPIAEFDIKKEFFKVLIVQKGKICDLLVLTFKLPNLWEYLWRLSYSLLTGHVW